jgi:hypothetical protein
MILGALNSRDDTAANSLAILNLSRSAYIFFELINYWTADAVPSDISLIRNIDPDIVPAVSMGSRTNISIFCKRLAGICAICNNRARVPDEIFTGLQLCHTCDAIYFPKISLSRLKSNFSIGRNALQALQCRLGSTKDENGELTMKVGLYFRWKDTQILISQGQIQLLPLINLERQIDIHNGEEYGCLSPPNADFDPDDGQGSADAWWPTSIIISDCLKNSNMDRQKQRSLSPSALEVAFFREFRYRFDPGWRHTTSFSESLIEYGRFARHWAAKSLWNERPWRLQNFPLQPRSAVIYPQFADVKERINQPSFKLHQFLSAKMRGLLKAFPDVLRSPRTWIHCMGDKSPSPSMSEAVELALQAKKVWKEPALQLLDFEIRKAEGEFDIEFVRSGKGLKPGGSHNEIGRTPENGEVWKVDIIRISGESIQTISQTRVGDVTHCLRPLLDECSSSTPDCRH